MHTKLTQHEFLHLIFFSFSIFVLSIFTQTWIFTLDFLLIFFFFYILLLLYFFFQNSKTALFLTLSCTSFLGGIFKLLLNTRITSFFSFSLLKKIGYYPFKKSDSHYIKRVKKTSHYFPLKFAGSKVNTFKLKLVSHFN